MAGKHPHGPRPGLARRARTCSALATALLAALAGFASPAHADEWRDKQWHLDFLEADQVHKITKGKGVTVAVVDTGVDANHPDLKGSVAPGTDVKGGDGRRDTDGHGTAMASLIAAHGHGPQNRDGILGLAPEAKILPIRDRSNGKSGDAVASAEGIEWAADQSADVLNFSATSGGLEQSVQEALDADVVVVAGVGNAAKGDIEVRAPARYPGVIAVSGIGRDGRFADISAQGPEVVLAAPAVDIAAAGAGERGDYNTATGTSDATALVAATAALVRAKFPHLTAGGVINRLIKTADDKGPPGRDNKYGFGVVNPLRALTADITDVEANPLLPKPSASPSATAAPPKQARGDGGDNSDLLVLLLVAAGLIVALTLAVLGGYFILRDRRARRPSAQTGISHKPVLTSGPPTKPETPHRPLQ